MPKFMDVSGSLAREAAVGEWVKRKLGSIGHEIRVSRVATMLFELTQPWHVMSKSEARLLTLGALVHDVGRAYGSKGHAKRGAQMILEKTELPLSETERRRLAFLTRYHRGDVPEAGREGYLEGSSDNISALRVLLGLLRAADGMDSRSLPGLQLVGTKRGRTLTIFGYVPGGMSDAIERLGRPKKFRLLEEALDCRVTTQWHVMERMAMVS